MCKLLQKMPNISLPYKCNKYTFVGSSSIFVTRYPDC